ncbi:MAG: SLBB domain-containing protein [Minicystis sp.]
MRSRPAACARWSWRGRFEARLKPFIVAPSVTVTLDEVQPARVSVLGEVTHPGVFVIPPGAGVLHALALAGGLTEFAGKDRVFVLRPRPRSAPLRVRFRYEDFSRGVGRCATFTLEPGDAVIVE